MEQLSCWLDVVVVRLILMTLVQMDLLMGTDLSFFRDWVTAFLFKFWQSCSGNF